VVGASVGVAPLTDLFNSIEAWVAAADEACYAAKAAGRGTVRLVHGRSGNVVELARPNQSD
jgi:predicted signal transduction protein with EAL and GGDEF domain